MEIDKDLILLDFLTNEQVGKILGYHSEHPSMRFGEIALKLGYITQEDLDSIIESV